MKPVFIILILFLILNDLKSSTQQDSIRIKIDSIAPLHTKDSLLHCIKELDLDFFRRNYNSFDNGQIVNLYNNEMNYTGVSPKTGTFSNSYSKFIIPTAFISYGLIARGNKSLRDLDKSTHTEVSKHFTGRTYIDNYTQFAPGVAVYAFDFAGLKPKHNFRDRTIILATSYVFMGVVVQGMKNSIDVRRPDGSDNKSFPSGHTATAFVGAHVLFKEYKDASPWLAASGYLAATTTGFFRVANRKHWVSDVVTGAGIGMLSAEVGYLLLPVWHRMLGIKNTDKKIVIIPSLGKNNYGLGLTYVY